MIAPGADGRSESGPKNMKASSRPRPGPGFDSTMNRIDLPVAVAWAAPSGDRTPWLMALLRNRTLAGSTKIDASGSRWASTSAWTPLPSHFTSTSTTGPMPRRPRIAMMPPRMPSEKLSMSISKPLGTLPSIGLVELLEQERRERRDDHRAEEHGDVGADDDAHGREGADDGPALTVDHAAAGVADEDRQQVGDDRADQLGQVLVRRPARGDEHGGDEAPGDERADVRHDHAGHEAAEALDLGANAGSLKILVDPSVGQCSGHVVDPFSDCGVTRAPWAMSQQNNTSRRKSSQNHKIGRWNGQTQESRDGSGGGRHDGGSL